MLLPIKNSLARMEHNTFLLNSTQDTTNSNKISFRCLGK